MKETHTIKIDPEIRREARQLAISRNTTFGNLVENLLKHELEEARKRGFGFTSERLGLGEAKVRCPECPFESNSYGMFVHLQNVHGYSRDRAREASL